MTGAVIVTGATGGIGRACVSALVERGMPVALVARRTDVVEELAERCRDAGVAASAHAVDLTDAAAVRTCVADAVDAHGVVRGLIGTAGEYAPDDLVDDRASMARMLDVNLLGPAALAATLAPHLVARGEGRIVHIGSVTAFVSRGGYGVYEASKAGLVAAARSLAVELAADGVTVNTVAPGWVATPMTEELLADVDRADVEALVPAGRVATAAEIAGVATWLALDAPLVMTGQTLVVDGGQSARTHHLSPSNHPTPRSNR